MPRRGWFYRNIYHLKISLVWSCRYVSACQTLSKYSKRLKSYSNFHKLITDGLTDGRTCWLQGTPRVLLSDDFTAGRATLWHKELILREIQVYEWKDKAWISFIFYFILFLFMQHAEVQEQNLAELHQPKGLLWGVNKLSREVTLVKTDFLYSEIESALKGKNLLSMRANSFL